MAKKSQNKRPGLQTSTKAGVRSLAKKLDNTRHGFATPPRAQKVPGASGLEDIPPAGRTKPGTATTHAGKAAALEHLKDS